MATKPMKSKKTAKGSNSKGAQAVFVTPNRGTKVKRVSVHHAKGSEIEIRITVKKGLAGHGVIRYPTPPPPPPIIDPWSGGFRVRLGSPEELKRKG